MLGCEQENEPSAASVLDAWDMFKGKVRLVHNLFSMTSVWVARLYLAPDQGQVELYGLGF